MRWEEDRKSNLKMVEARGSLNYVIYVHRIWPYFCHIFASHFAFTLLNSLQVYVLIYLTHLDCTLAIIDVSFD